MNDFNNDQVRKITAELMSFSRPDKIAAIQRFFKTGKGDYGEGDIFLAITNPDVRYLVKKYARAITPDETVTFVTSQYHEIRFFGLLCWIEQMRKLPLEGKLNIYELYKKYMKYVNNWDLVDLTAPHLVGPFVTMDQLRTWAKSSDLWERRIAMLATFYTINKGDPKPAIEIADILLHDKHDLIHKAVGWMLREAGKRCGEDILTNYLDLHAQEMPRTMLRYSLEKLSEEKRKKYMTK